MENQVITEEATAEQPEIHEIKSSSKFLEEVNSKVFWWFDKNDRDEEFNIDFEEATIHSKNESCESRDASFNSPLSYVSDSSSLNEANYDIKRKTYKEPVKPIQLNPKKLYEVEIVNFESIDSFFISIKRNERRWNRLIRRLNKAKANLEPISKISRGHLCLIKSENDELLRAIVQNNNDRFAICFGLDNGKLYILDTKSQPVYRMTPKIRNTIEYQAIHCKLSGVRMVNNQDVAKFIHDTVISKIKSPKIRTAKQKYSRIVDDRCMALVKYEVMLFDGDADQSVNEDINVSIRGLID